MNGVKIIVPATVGPLTFAEAISHLRLTPDTLDDDSPPAYTIYSEDADVRALMAAATDFCQEDIMRSLAPRTLEFMSDSFPSGRIVLPYGPVWSVESASYLDGDGASQSIAASVYTLDTYGEPHGLMLNANQVWPTGNTVKVRYVAGYSDPDDSPSPYPMPEAIKQAMKLLIGHWFENREAVVMLTVTSTLDLAVKALLRPYQLRMSMA